MANTNYPVQFLTGTSAGYAEIVSKDAYSFYFCTDTNDLYLGEQKLTSGADLAAAITRIAANEGNIATLQSAVNTLNGDSQTEGSVRKITADAIAEIVAGAPESLNTLKELSDWIENHAQDAAAMNSAILALQHFVGELPDGTESDNLVDYIAEFLEANGYNPFNVLKPTDVLVIPEEAYANDQTIQTASFPRALAVEKKAFYGAMQLASANLPLAQTVAESAFESAIALTEINLPVATSVGKNSFAMCMAATKLNAPLLECVGNGAFQNNSFTEVDLPSCHTIEDVGFGGSFYLASINITNVRTIGSGAFQDAHEVEILKLHKIEFIGNNAFFDCPKLKEVYIYTDFVAEAEENIFNKTPMDTPDETTGEVEGKIYVPGYLVDAYKAASGWSQYANCIYAIPGTELAPAELPASTIADAGKVLKVDAEGNWSKGEDNSAIYWQTF